MSTDLETLDEATCTALLGGVQVGRVAWAEDDGTVTVLPVNFVLDGDAVVFATAAGAKLDAVRDGRHLTFEADDFEPALRTAWSVLLAGPSEVVTDPVEVERLQTLPLAPWIGSAGTFFVRVNPRRISGRRIPLHAGGVTTERVDPTDEAG